MNHKPEVTPSPTVEGWGWPGGAAKPHYFVNAMSLCMKWLWSGPLDPKGDGPGSTKDCAPCRRALGWIK